jgi:hypothetical protein
MDGKTRTGEIDPMRLGAAVKLAMGDWTQVALRDATGIPQGRISNIINHSRGEKPTLEETVKIEDALGLPRGFILAVAGIVTVEGATRGAEVAARAARAARRKSGGPR